MAPNGIRVSLADLSSPADTAAWNAFVDAADGAANYHRSGWLGVVEKTFGHAPYPLWARDDAGVVLGILPVVLMRSRLFGTFLTSLPFFNFGGVLAEDPAASNALIERAGALVRECGAQFLELRHIGAVAQGLPSKTHKVTMRLDLAPGAEALWEGFKAKVRNQVRKATKSGLTVATGRHELLDDFYEVFARNMRDLGTPVYSKKLFANVLDAFPESTRLFTVNHADGCVAAGLGTWYRSIFEIPWASSIRDYNSLCPNNLLYWTLIEHACAEGCSTFDFGRSTPEKGTFRFKKQWGAEPVQLNWQYIMPNGGELPEMNPENAKFQFAIRVWRKLPVPLTKLIGPSIVRNIP
ncbi:FemAB family XrtA/PEP-CTERM system-associated protein [Desulfovibrio sp. Fe33]|uniref:FemAB family XrtA/PEP-CTERM system-associated protein n=1 Tax=Desulfovibrio sp. Fe33 TaxID=3020842 RepID=UPI00234DFAC8|nr:FemAB family XrtA/PEP-CTERM system-associated protein [Desulfovibrio sp. Fe33]